MDRNSRHSPGTPDGPAPAPAPVPRATTRRAYTLRLRRSPGACSACDKDDCACWRDALWATHEAVNKGARVFGDWLLTLRGGLSHELAEPPAPARGKKRAKEETAALRKNRRILLALSWLSVEDERGAPPIDDWVIGRGKGCKLGLPDTDEQRKDKLVARLRSILERRKLSKRDIDSWMDDCAPSLSSRIRDDAVWIDRSAAFDAKAGELEGLTRDYAHATVMSFFGPDDAYFKVPTVDADEDTAAPADEGPEFRTRARQWASTNFGTGDKSDIQQIVKSLRKLASADLNGFVRRPKSELIAAMSKKVAGPSPDDDGLRVGIGWSTGRPSKGRLAINNLPDRLTSTDIEALQAKLAEEADDKQEQAGLRDVPDWMPRFRASIEQVCDIPFVGKRDHIGEFSVMLDHAARRVSIAHSWIKRAEAERRDFEADAQRLAEVPSDAAEWLDAYTLQRTGLSGAVGEYRIRRRAIEAWDDVLKRWNRADCSTTDDRIAAAREVQADSEIEKFGDIQLFEALAAGDAECVWRSNGKVDPSPLRDYVLGHDARFRQRWFKVPAYRHPDPLRHPVFCDFGKSRWAVDYALHRQRSGVKAARKKVEGCEDTVKKAQASLDQSKTREKQAKAREKLLAAQQKLADARKDLSWLSDPRAMRMGLWTGDSVAFIDSLRWSSKRVAADLGAVNHNGDAEAAVSRGDRLGRAAAGVGDGAAPIPAGLFEQEGWNARLQAPRRELDRLAARVDRHGWDGRARKMRDNLSWLVTLSAKLECRGPWYSYFEQQPDKSPPFLKMVKTGARKGQTYASPNGWPHAIPNGEREGHAKLVLSRLPGLRVLSVDLGHRFAAACAVWEAISAEEVAKACRECGHREPRESDLFMHLTHTVKKERKKGRDKGKIADVVETTIYRRIGPDKLSDGSDHPAPWARLDRQFLIKLQGEEKSARAASKDELAFVRQLEQALGRTRAEEDRCRSGWTRDCDHPLPRRVDELMAEAMRSLRLGLARHGRRAKIAWALDPETNSVPGMGVGETQFTLGDDDHIRLLTNALFDWHALATDRRWDDSAARDLWNEHVASLTGGWKVEPPEPDPLEPDERTHQQRRKEDEALRDRLRSVAQALATSDRVAMHAAWRVRWLRDDGTPADCEGGTPATGWHARLRRVSDWVTGRRYPGDESPSHGWKQNVGGLSLTRIATMRSLYQLHKAFAMRARPDKPRGAPEKGESNAGVAQSLLDAMERMREQRVKQLASRIVEAALGVGRMKPTKGRDRKRPQSRVDEPCHAVVIESLRHYRPDELRTRRENRALMTWSSGKVRKYLEEACQLHGLHLREVMPNYTSRQCSRTGLPGRRCVDVPVDAKTGDPNAYWWKRALASAKKKGDAESRFIVDLAAHLADLKTNGVPLPKTVRVPRNGGDLFVAAPSWRDLNRNGDGASGSALQADLNAAANIGLRALLDPDLSGRWWYVLCEAATGTPARDRYAGAAGIDLDKRIPGLPNEADGATGRGRGGRGDRGDRINAWRDVGSADDWRGHAAYWNDVRARVAAALRRANGLSDPEGSPRGRP